MSAYITSVGSYLPGEPVGNDEIETYLGGSPGSDRLRRRMLEANGIEKRHYAIDRQGRTLMLNEELAEAAIRAALQDRGNDAKGHGGVHRPGPGRTHRPQGDRSPSGPLQLGVFPL
jgi:3-oxoacyl-[acyl-carrier-protein] synthase-3